MASTPQRIEKDLQQIRQLAAVLENEYATLRRMKDGAPEPKMEDSKSHGKDGEQGDVIMAGAATNQADANGHAEVEPEPELLEKGSEAVDQRVEKLVAEMQAQRMNMEDSGVESAMMAKKVCFDRFICVIYPTYFFNISVPHCSRSVPDVPSYGI